MKTWSVALALTLSCVLGLSAQQMAETDDPDAAVAELLASEGFTAISDNIFVNEDVDEMTDEDRSTVTVFNDGMSRNFAFINWRCRASTLELFISNRRFLNTRERIRVMYRFDDDEPATGRWGSSTSGTAAFARSRDISAFTNRALEAQRVTIRLYNYRGTPYTYTFQLNKLGEGLRMLSCVDWADDS